MHRSGSLVGKLGGKNGECVWNKQLTSWPKGKKMGKKKGLTVPQENTPRAYRTPTKLHLLSAPPLPNGAVWGSGC